MAWASATTDYWNDWAKNSNIKKEDYFTVSNLTQYTGGEKYIDLNILNKDKKIEDLIVK